MSTPDTHNISDTLSHYRTLLNDVTTKDHFRLSRQFAIVKKAFAGQSSSEQSPDNHPPSQYQGVSSVQKGKTAWDTLTAQIEASHARVEQRRAALPTVTFPEELPISEKRELIAEAIAQHQVVVLAGETGAGKTTQLPKICLSLGRGVRGMIGHTQPRRIAARTVATRIAEELQTPLGE